MRTPGFWINYPHLVDRARERYGLALTPEHVNEARRQISAGRARYVRKGRGDRDVWEVRLGKRDCRVIYDAAVDRLITFLP
jgi:hypothetical protein